MPFQAEPLALLADPGVRARTAAFAAAPPLPPLPPSAVCLLQGEAALLTPACAHAALPSHLGSPEATTCCLVFVRSLDGSHAAAAHVDFEEAAGALFRELEAAGFFSQPLEVSLEVPIANGITRQPREWRRAAAWLRRVADWWEFLADQQEAKEEGR